MKMNYVLSALQVSETKKLAKNGGKIMIKTIFLDADGVLSTGSFFYTSDGKFMKEFSCLDGKGFTKAKKKNIHILVITEEPDELGFGITQKRCEDQNINYVRAEDPQDKLSVAEAHCEEWGIGLSESAFIADDIGDFYLLREVGIPIAVSNATTEIKKIAEKERGYVTDKKGGHGAVREAIEWLLGKRSS